MAHWKIMIFGGQIVQCVSSKMRLNCLNSRFVKKVIVVLPKLCRMDQNWHACVLASFWESYCGIGVLSESFLGLPKCSTLAFWVLIRGRMTKLRIILSKPPLCSYFSFTNLLSWIIKIIANYVFLKWNFE